MSGRCTRLSSGRLVPLPAVSPLSVKAKHIFAVGAAGLALALWRAGNLQQRQDWLNHARHLAQGALVHIGSSPRYYVQESLLDGTAGVVLVNCLVLGGSADRSQVQQLLSSYTDICRTASAAGADAESDEFLYGRAGTLFGALLLRKQFGTSAVPDEVVGGLVDGMLASGRSLASKFPIFQASGCPLAYMWPSGRSAEPYLGAAHGLTGILYVLLHCTRWLERDPAAMRDIQNSLRFVLSCETDAPGNPQGSGGHYPATMALAGQLYMPDRQALVHWCHGAPGAVFLFCKAFEVSSEPAYLQAALRAGELVWQRGLLKKGPGLCHGVAGNAYALLRLWKTTQDVKWLERGKLFAAFMLSPAGKADWATPDHPTSLYEGAAGCLCLLAELQAVSQQQQQQQGSTQTAAAVLGTAAHAPAGASELQTASTLVFPLFELWG